MPLEIGLWRVDGDPVRVSAAPMPLESRLEELIEADPAILGEPLLFIGRQVPTAHGKFIDLLGVDGDGDLHVLELKRDRTPREVVAQALDYGSWIATLGHDDVVAIFETNRPGLAFEQAFSEQFGVSPPDELNASHRLTVVASEVDPASARIVEYLIGFGVPINVLFFRYFADGERQEPRPATAPGAWNGSRRRAMHRRRRASTTRSRGIEPRRLTTANGHGSIVSARREIAPVRRGNGQSPPPTS